MGGQDRQARLRTRKADKPVRYGTSGALTRNPAKILCSIRMGEATLNWQVSPREIEAAHSVVNHDLPPLLAPEMGRSPTPEEMKTLVRQSIIDNLTGNRHTKRKGSVQTAYSMMWYMHHKRDTLPPYEEIDRITMVITKNRDPASGEVYHQFSWEIGNRTDISPDLPPLERINVYSRYKH